jgi:hypothetical protein
MSLVSVAVVMLFFAGCEDRPPISRAQVVSNAYNLQLRDGLTWGDAVETLSPITADDRGHRWWQVRYRPGLNGEIRIMLVDAESGWARHAPAEYVPRLSLPVKASGDVPLTIAEGSYVLVVAPGKVVDAEQRRALEQEVLRLNALGTNTGLMPLFSLREQRDQQVSLIYGWQHERGIAREPRVVEWLTARTPYREPVWEDLAPRP